jgi:hypothetical protein
LDAFAGERFSYVLAAKLAGEPADDYIHRRIIQPLSHALGTEPSLDGLGEALLGGYESFKALATNYIFPKHTHEISPHGPIACLALDKTLGGSSFEDFLESEDLEALWLSFNEACEEAGVKPKEQESRPLLEGFAELNMEVFSQKGEASLFAWLQGEMLETQQVDFLFERLTEIRGLGPKNASTLLRDAAYIFDLEDEIRASDRPYLQPIHASLRKVAAYLVRPENDERLHDWVLAGKLAKLCREAGVSGVLTNMGALQLGSIDSQNLDDEIRRLVLEG